MPFSKIEQPDPAISEEQRLLQWTMRHSGNREQRNLAMDLHNLTFKGSLTTGFVATRNGRAHPSVCNLYAGQQRLTTKGTSDLQQAEAMKNKQQPEGFAKGHAPKDFEPTGYNSEGEITGFKMKAASKARLDKEAAAKARARARAAKAKNDTALALAAMTQERDELQEALARCKRQRKDLYNENKALKERVAELEAENATTDLSDESDDEGGVTPPPGLAARLRRA